MASARIATEATPFSADEFVAEMRKRVDEELRQAALAVKNEAIRIATDEDRVDLGDYIKGITDPQPVNEGGLIGYEVEATARHSAVIEYGRHAGAKMPPPTELEGWVRRKLGVSDPAEVKAVAFLVARHIQAQGIEPGHVMRRAIDSIDIETFRRDVLGAIQR